MTPIANYLVLIIPETRHNLKMTIFDLDRHELPLQGFGWTIRLINTLVLDIIISNIIPREIALVLAKAVTSLYSERGNEIPNVQMIIINDLIKF
jgi:hypothetical protein